MTTEIPLRSRYRALGSAKKTRSGYDGNAKPARQKRRLSDTEKAMHARQPVKIMRLVNGKRRMETIS